MHHFLTCSSPRENTESMDEYSVLVHPYRLGSITGVVSSANVPTLNPSIWELIFDILIQIFVS